MKSIPSADVFIVYPDGSTASDTVEGAYISIKYIFLMMNLFYRMR